MMDTHIRPKHIEKKINTLKEIVHKVGFIYKIYAGVLVNKT